jgi:hypothetical protein
MKGCSFLLLDDSLAVILALSYRCDYVCKFTESSTKLLDIVVLDLEEEEDFSPLGKTRSA